MCVVGWVVEWVMVVYLDGVLCGEDGWDAAITLARVRRTGVEQAQDTRGTRAVHAVLQPRGASVQPSSAVRHDILALLEMETGTAPLF